MSPARRKTFAWPKTKSGCREFRGRRNPAGYGIANLVCVDGVTRPINVARWVLEMSIGRRLETQTELTRHSCDNPPCFLASHILIGTPKDNMQDMISRGRKRSVSLKGEANGTAKLTNEDVLMIRASHRPVAALAAELGVSPRAVWLARVRQTWRHLP